MSSIKYRCQLCNKKKGRNAFSKKQMNKSKYERKCKKCITKAKKPAILTNNESPKSSVAKTKPIQIPQIEGEITKDDSQSIPLNLNISKKQNKVDDCIVCCNTGMTKVSDGRDGHCVQCNRGAIHILKELKKVEISDLQQKQRSEIQKIRSEWDKLIRNTEENGTFKNICDTKEAKDTECDDLFCGVCDGFDETKKVNQCQICDMLICEECTNDSNCCSSEYCEAVFCDKCQNEPFGLESMKCGQKLCKDGCCGYHVRSCQCRDELWW